jgi:hypothetical protein
MKHKHYFKLKILWTSFPNTEQKVFKGYEYCNCECGLNPYDYKEANSYLQRIFRQEWL